MLKFEFDLRGLDKLPEAQETLVNGLASLMQQVGVYVLQEQKFNFEAKSRGGTGADGVKWKPLTQTTEFLKQTRYISKTRKKDETGFTEKQKAAALKNRRKMRAKLNAKMGPFKRSQIGVDRGLLRNSVKPGYAGPDGKGGNILTVNGNRVTVGYGREYAKFFDATRPLLPSETSLPDAWKQGIDEIAQEWVDGIAKSLGL